jgi:glycosyltransferase involved in cell wall biosynthesis
MEDGRTTVLLAINRMIIGGAEQQFLELAKGLDKKRFRTIVVTLYSGGDLESQTKEIAGTEYICLNRRGKLDFWPLFTVLRILWKRKVDIVQPFLSPATFFVLLPAILSRTPVKVVTERGNWRKKLGLGYHIYLSIEDFFTRFADWVIPNSKSGADYLVNRGINPERIKVIYNGINMNRLDSHPEKAAQIKEQMGISPDVPVVGISASLTPSKDHVTFLRAAQLVTREIPQVKFAILGDGPLRSDLEDMTNKLGLRSNVIFLGNQTEIGPYISTFNLACLCSAEPEGCSNAILEAMALGKPVVATDAGGNRELVAEGETGWLVPVQDTPALAAAILACLREPARAEEMGRRAEEIIAARFGLDRMVRDYEEVYQETMEAKKSRGSRSG